MWGLLGHWEWTVRTSLSQGQGEIGAGEEEEEVGKFTNLCIGRTSFCLCYILWYCQLQLKCNFGVFMLSSVFYILYIFFFIYNNVDIEFFLKHLRTLVVCYLKTILYTVILDIYRDFKLPKLGKITKKVIFSLPYPGTQLFQKYWFGSLTLKVKVVLSNIHYVNT